MELGLFLALVVLGAAGFIRRSITFLSISIAVLFILAVYFSTGVDVVAETQMPAMNVTRTSSALSYNSTGHVVGNTTTTETTQLPAYKEEVPVISSNQFMLSYIFFAFAIFASLILTKGLFSSWGWT